MVGIVVVSHSRVLAEALVKLASQVANQDIPIAFSGGAGPDHLEFGTDAIDIMEAVQSVYSPDGVLILMDLGSAVLSAEMALELLPEDMSAQIRLSPCPLVEGTITAVVQSGLGSDLETIFEEAQNSLTPKSEHLGYVGSSEMLEETESPILEVGPAKEISVILENEHGLHARPAARFVQLAATYDAQIKVRNPRTDKGPVSARSLNALATLGAVKGDQVQIAASGPQADSALEALRQLISSKFGEEDDTITDQSLSEFPESRILEEPTEPGTLKGIAVVEGIAIGSAYLFSPPPAKIPEQNAEDPQIEWDIFQVARDSVLREIGDRKLLVQAKLGKSQAAIFEAHQLILEDPVLQEKVRTGIFDQNMNAAQAWAQAFQSVAEDYRSLDDLYLQQRAQDVEDVGNQVLIMIAGEDTNAKLELDQPRILIAQELTPTQTAQLDLDKILGLVTVSGGPTSHSAILARALGIPYISGVNPTVTSLAADTQLGLDCFDGVIFIDPEEDTLNQLQQQRKEWLAQRADLLSASLEPAVTRDGHHVEILANVGTPQDAEAAVNNGAQGIGLLRTEFLYLARTSPPTEDEQFEILSQIGEITGDHPVTVRTLDVGGDKFLPFINQEAEANPYLGVRAIRLSLREPDLFQTQIKAILRAGVGKSFRIMFPMVTGLSEINQAKSLIEESHKSLRDHNIPHLWPVETGIMVETPAAAILSAGLAPHIDFFSIGTNDLTQYTLAAERGNHRLAEYHDGLNPAVLDLIDRVATAAHRYGKWVGICGELASDVEAVPILLGLEVDELSINPASIPAVKAVIRKLDTTELATLANQARALDTAQQIRGLVQNFLIELSSPEP